jgi:hypothetical protein
MLDSSGIEGKHNCRAKHDCGCGFQGWKFLKEGLKRKNNHWQR